MHIAIATMVYNERVNLPIWIRHYRMQCPLATLFVIDHGSNDDSTRDLDGVNIIPLPRTPFDDQVRADFVADMQRSLLRFHDIFIYTDCDEMLVADPRKYPSLSSLLEATHAEVVAPVGLNVQHLLGIEAPIDVAAPILGQRRYAAFGVSLCKPAIARVPVSWVPGFHWCDRLPEYRNDLYLFHLKRMDAAVALSRLQVTRNMAWSERALHHWGRTQRESDEVRMRARFEAPTERFRAQGTAPFAFDAQLTRLRDSMRLTNGYYQGEIFGGPLVLIPDAFFGMI